MPKKILVVDDEPELVAMVKMRLEANQYQVVTATDGAEGLAKALEELPDLILLDIAMPKMDGLQVLRQLKHDRRTRRIPVIMLTASGGSSAIMDSQELQAADYFIKPFDSQELLALIQRYLR